MRVRAFRLKYVVVVSCLVGIGCGGGGTPTVIPAGSANPTASANPAPVLTGVAPNSVTAGAAAVTITVSGSGFAPASIVEWNGAALNTAYVSATSLTAQIPSADLTTAAIAKVTVNNPSPGGGASGAVDFTIANPVATIRSISPASVTAGSSDLTLTVTGTEFVSSSQVLWNGSTASTTFVSATTLTAQIAASDLSGGGTVSLAVQNPTPGGGISNAVGFTIDNPVATVSSVSPNTIVAAGLPLTITVTGTQFVPNSLVLWNGTQVPTTYVSTTSVTAQISGSSLDTAGIDGIAVQNPAPGGGTSNAVTFTIANPLATIASLSPSSVTVGSPSATITVTGTDFVPSSQVQWNGMQVPTTYVSATELTAQIASSSLSTLGIEEIAVQNPTPGGGTSNSLPFTVAPLATKLEVVDVTGSDVVWDSVQQKFYVAVPAGASTNGSTITVVDPADGTTTAQQLSSAASGLAISDDSQYLYAAMNGAATIQRFTLPALAPDIQWSLGTDPVTGTALLVSDIKVEPGAAHTVAVSYTQFGSAAVAVFDDDVKRPAVASTYGNSLQWKADGTELYATMGEASATGGSTTGSDIALWVMPVNSGGIGAQTIYNSCFRREGARLHLDPATGYVYTDWGEVVDTANGIPVGNYGWNRPSGTSFLGPLSINDPVLKRFYTVSPISEPDGSRAFQVQSFDQNNFRALSTVVIPNAVGWPANFIRWGRAGLAIITNGGSTSDPGKLYILDGGFINANDLDNVAGNAITPVPTLTSITPLTATVGSGAITLTVSGRDFAAQPTIYWNGTALATTVVDSTDLSAQIPASDLASVTQAEITVSNGGAAFPGSNAMPFSVNAAPPSGNQISVYPTGGDDLVWDATAGKLYVSMPAVQGDSGNTVGIIDPLAGSVATTAFVGSEPARLAVSDDGQYLYAALYGENAIEQLALPTFTVSNKWNLGSDSFDGPFYALDLQVAPGLPQTTAVTLANFTVSPPSKAVVIYDGSTPRSTPLQVMAYPYAWLAWGNSSTLYALDDETPQGVFVLGVGPTGATLDAHYERILNGFSSGVHYDAGTGLVYTDGGQAIQPSNGSIVGSYGFSGFAVTDSSLGRVFILGQTSAQAGTSNYTIESFNQTNFTLIDSLIVQNVVGAPTAFVRWGSNGLAFTTRVGNITWLDGAGPGQLYVINGTFVKP